MDLVKAKIGQAIDLLREFDVDMWLMFVRESTMQSDPMMPMLVGFDVTWQSSFIYSREHGAVALVGNFDQENFKRSERFDRVIPYTQGVKQDLLKVLDEFAPQSIAVNFSPDDPGADGLTHGMYLKLLEHIGGTQFENRLISADTLCSKVRSRKLPEELDRLQRAAEVSDGIWRDLVSRWKPGLSERVIGSMIDEEIQKAGAEIAFHTIVNAGSKTEPGHVRPTDAEIEAGEILHVDFGAKLDGYCADIQRLAYFKRDGEDGPPEEVRNAFNTVRDIITGTARASRPRVRGFEVDQIARKMLTDAGYPEYHHALGHQLGRNVHDGGGILGPRWERYGTTATVPLEESNVFTLELEINLPGTGCIGLEEDVVVTPEGARFLSPRQQELVVI